MNGMKDSNGSYDFGPYRLDPRTRVLLKDGEVFRLTPKVLDTLLVLVENAGNPVSKEVLMRSVWPDTLVEESNLSQNISVLRKAFGSPDGGPRIETIPKRGYRFVADVRPSPAQSSKTEKSSSEAAESSSLMAPSASSDRREASKTRYRMNIRRTLGIAVTTVAVMAGVAGALHYSAGRPTDPAKWVQLTKFPDPVSQPALSPDGRTMAFIRSSGTFFAEGQVYVKSVPDGEPRQLTHDSLMKTNPVFAPDGIRVAYTTLDANFNWDTWVVSTEGGEPQRWWRNVSDLVWTGYHQVLFSERPSKAIVAAAEDLSDRHTVYRPPNDRGVARRPQPSPDGKWVLLAELSAYGDWEPCRVVPMDGSSTGRQVGPAGAECTSAAWSPDGQWMYLTSKSGGLYHIWRQRFAGGQPMQVTTGLTEEEGIAFLPQGGFFVTAVSLKNSSIWLHRAGEERQVSQLEGNAVYPKFTPDGAKVCYRIVKDVPFSGTTTYREVGDLWIADLRSGRSRPLADFPVHDYDISPDGSQVVIEADDRDHKPRLWLAPIDGSSPPRKIPDVEGRQAVFGPGGEIIFRRIEGQSGFAYAVQPDGTGLRRAVEQPVLAVTGASPDGRWIEGWAQLPGSRIPEVQLFSRTGGPPALLGSSVWWQWSRDRRTLWMQGGPIAQGRSYAIPLAPGEIVPPVPPDGFRFEEEVARLPGAQRIDAIGAPGPALDTYAFEHRTIQRNLYRIPIR